MNLNTCPFLPQFMYWNCIECQNSCVQLDEMKLQIVTMDMEQNGNQNPVPLCRAGCGFYGNTAFEGMCSKCYKDAMKRKENAPTLSGRLSPVATSTVTTVTAPGETDSVGNVTSTLAHTSLGTVLIILSVCVCLLYA